MKSKRATLDSVLIILTIFCLLLVCIIALRYSYNSFSALESGLGILVLTATAGFLWFFRNREHRYINLSKRNGTLLFGIVLGLLWAIEISINNFIAPPLPARDIIDNIFWAIIAFSILVFSIIQAHQNNGLVFGIDAGIWSGFASGLMACCMAMVVVTIGMHFILKDPLNISEWNELGTSTHAPTMAAYFAFETLAGAFGHLIILGVVMGGVLGVIGACIGKGFRRILCLKRKA